MHVLRPCAVAVSAAFGLAASLISPSVSAQSPQGGPPSFVTFPRLQLDQPESNRGHLVWTGDGFAPAPFVHAVAPGQPAPNYMIADNDRATGQLVEAVSKSPYWSDTLILITEDDPSGAADHLDSHRSFALVVSPWAQRRKLSHVRASFPSLAATYQRALGLSPYG